MISDDEQDDKKKGTQAIHTRAYKDLQLGKKQSSMMDGK